MHPTCYARVNDVLEFYCHGTRIIGRVKAVAVGRMTVLTIRVAQVNDEVVSGVALEVDYGFNEMEKITNLGPNSVVRLGGWGSNDVLILA